jgi:hypothetical protein
MLGELTRIEDGMRNTSKWSQNLNGKDHLRDREVAGKMILRWILEIYVYGVKVRLDQSISGHCQTLS